MVVVAPDNGAQEDLRMRVAIVVRIEGETPTVVSVEYIQPYRSHSFYSCVGDQIDRDR